MHTSIAWPWIPPRTPLLRNTSSQQSAFDLAPLCLGQVLKDIFQSLGFGEITDEDVGILVETGDVDKDGKISLTDFRNMLDFNAPDDDDEQEKEGGGLSEAQQHQADDQRETQERDGAGGDNAGAAGER